MAKRKKAIPDGWEHYTEIGKRIQNTKFLPFKVPLKKETCEKAGLSFTPEKLLGKEPNLKLIIDLNNSNDGRYYWADTFKNQGLYFAKIQCPGGPRQVPPEALVQKFHNIVDEFLRNNISSDSLIGVHCTHGINRTGYFICRYMVDKMNVKPAKAIEYFQTARGHAIERPLIINAILEISANTSNYHQSPLGDCHEYDDARTRRQYRGNNWR